MERRRASGSEGLRAWKLEVGSWKLSDCAPIMSPSSSRLFLQANLPDHHLAIDGLEHVVDGQSRGRHGRQASISTPVCAVVRTVAVMR